jgi:ribosomal protein L39E
MHDTLETRRRIAQQLQHLALDDIQAIVCRFARVHRQTRRIPVRVYLPVRTACQVRFSMLTLVVS